MQNESIHNLNTFNYLMNNLQPVQCVFSALLSFGLSLDYQNRTVQF